MNHSIIPPIPLRQFDWCAYRGSEGNSDSSNSGQRSHMSVEGYSLAAKENSDIGAPLFLIGLVGMFVCYAIMLMRR